MKRYNAQSNGEYVRKFIKSDSAFMNGVWSQFNKYAKSKGFVISVEDSRYFGGLAWSNGKDIMELVKR